MSAYTVRVELHSDNYSDFVSLHSNMEGEGFSRFISSDDGVTYHLLRAEYNLPISTRSRSEVLLAAKRAVKATGKNGEILVTEASARTWSGLTEVK